MTDADAHSDESDALDSFLALGTSIVRAARWLLVRIELTTAFLSVAYLVLIVADMFLSELTDSQSCSAEVEHTAFMVSWRRSYEWADLAFLLFFAFEIMLHLIAEGVRGYLRSPLNSIDAITVCSSLVLAVLSMRYTNLSSFGVLRLFRLTRIVKMVGAYNRLVAMRDRWQTRRWKKRIQRSEAASALVWQDSGELIKMAPPKEGERGFHLFLSHRWMHAQDNAVSIKTALRNLVPSCRIFLDVDDLHDLNDLEKEVARSDVVLIIVTAKYLTSQNCRRELVEAFRLNKPLVMVMECDPDKGSTSVLGMRAELEGLERDGLLTQIESDAAQGSSQG